MKRFKRILYLTSYREDEAFALRQAVARTRENAAQLTVASMSPHFPDRLSAERLAMLKSDVQSIELHRQSFVLGDELRVLQDETPPVHVSFSGTSFVEVIHYVIEKNIDLVVIPAKPQQDGRGGFSSDIMHLMRKCPCAIWAIRPEHAQGFQSVLAAVDPVTLRIQDTDFNRTLLELACSQALYSNAEVHAVHAWQLAGKEWLQSPLLEIPQDELDHLYQETKADHQEALDTLLCPFEHGDVDLQQHLIEGDASTVIRHCEITFSTDLLVMGTLNRTGIQGVYMGLTSEDIIQHTNASVLALKPREFVSPFRAASPKEPA